jgi:hypothetical protein
MSDMKIISDSYKQSTTWKDIEDFIMTDGKEKEKIAERICCMKIEIPDETTKV